MPENVSQCSSRLKNNTKTIASQTPQPTPREQCTAGILHDYSDGSTLGHVIANAAVKAMLHNIPHDNSWSESPHGSLDTMAHHHLALEKVWVDKSQYEDAERLYYEKQAKSHFKKLVQGTSNTPNNLSLAGEVAKARQHIKKSLDSVHRAPQFQENLWHTKTFYLVMILLVARRVFLFHRKS
uniref:Uncharacterized protein n=1 Tax=Timema monikensis TaxID=170555 RepID=A0A7R9HQQ9_9NEOP|nr:unnamed protein product [Timema monikensis]